MDPRHQRRIKIIQNLYASAFDPTGKNLSFSQNAETKEIIGQIKKIDDLISQFAVKLPLAKIAKTDLAILRWAIYELIIKKRLPEKVVVNEAIELAKELAGERSYAFVNAVLGKILHHE